MRCRSQEGKVEGALVLKEIVMMDKLQGWWRGISGREQRLVAVVAACCSSASSIGPFGSPWPAASPSRSGRW